MAKKKQKKAKGKSKGAKKPAAAKKGKRAAEPKAAQAEAKKKAPAGEAGRAMREQTDHPSFDALDEIQEKALVARLDATREVLAHAGEKGRALEGEVMGLLRALLPAEYGLGTGFIVHHGDKGPELSPQLDIVIYDAIRSAPLAAFETCEVFPLEAVYGYVEVKARLRTSDVDPPPHDSLECCVAKSAQVRTMTACQYWRPIEGTMTGAQLMSGRRIPVRSYLFAFEYAGSGSHDQQYFAVRMANAAKKYGLAAHIHGAYVGDFGFFSTFAVESPEDSRLHSTRFYRDHALSHFKWALLHGLARCDRFPLNWTPAIDRYRPITPESEAAEPSS